VSRNESSTGFVQLYGELIRPARRQGVIVILLVLLSAFFEGIALVALVPLLSSDPRVDIGGVRLAGVGLRRLSLVVVFAIGLAAAIVKYFAESRALRFLSETEARLRRTVTEQYVSMNWSDFVSMRLGDINSATLLAASQIAIGAHFFLRAIAAILAAALLASLSFAAAPLLSTVTVAFGALVLLGYRIGSRRALLHAQDLTTRAEDIGVAVHDVFSNLKFFQSTGNIEAATEQTSGAYERYADTWYRSQRYGPLMRMSFESGAVVAIAAILGLAVFRDGVLTPRDVAFLAIFSRAVPRLTLAQEWTQLARVNLPWYESWRERAAVASAGRRVRQTGRRVSELTSIAATSVSFRYPDTERLALHNVSWTVDQGGFLAVVGASGSGKTTMLDVVTGLLEPNTGSININGEPLRSIDLDAWQASIGLVMQTNPMLHTSIAENVRWTQPDLDQQRLRSSLIAAGAIEFVDALPHGVDTIVGEAGAKLSGGQVQRIALARALYRDPLLLVLDEPTSALDSHSEQQVIASIDGLRGAVTIIVSTHRLALIRAADEILVMEHGVVVERGQWEELVQRDGVFSRIVGSSAEAEQRGS
jgi:ABC-type multidrug transport system fused ATPase/permease subunit